MTTKLLSIVTCLLLLTSFCFSQGKWKVAVDLDGEDILGQQLAYRVKEQVNRSSFFLLVPKDEANLVVRILSSDIGTIVGVESICSVAYTTQFPTKSGEYFCNHTVCRFGSGRIDAVVSDVLAKTLDACEGCVGSSWKTKE